MPDPISSNTDPTLLPEITNEENEARMSLISAHPDAPNPTTVAPAAAPSAPASPAVGALVARFSAPSGSHPPIEPSLGKAILECASPIGNYLLNLGIVVGTAPETGGVSLANAARVLSAASSAQTCIAQSEAKQVQDGTRANLAADCRAEGAVPLTTPDGNVVCAK
jgi:hypothetical protein